MGKDDSVITNVFDVFLPKERERCYEVAKMLGQAADAYMFCENLLWSTWRLHDPCTLQEVVAAVEHKRETGKYPSLPKYMGVRPDGVDPSTYLRSLCPDVHGSIIDQACNWVSGKYRNNSNRWGILFYRKSLPCARSPVIRIKGQTGVWLRRQPDNPQWFQVGVCLLKGKHTRKTAPLWLDISLKGANEWTRDFLAERADEGTGLPSISLHQKKRRGKKIWQLAITRPRRDGERDQVNPIAGRFLFCYPPAKQNVALECEILPLNGRPWRMPIQDRDIYQTKKVYEKRRKTMGANYRQSPSGSVRGHGRQRAIRGKLPLSERYKNRIKSWIEERTRAIVDFAIEARCEMVCLQDFAKLKPSELRLGSFPYDQFETRLKAKSDEAGLDFKVLSDTKAIAEVANIDVVRG